MPAHPSPTNNARIVSTKKKRKRERNSVQGTAAPSHCLPILRSLPLPSSRSRRLAAYLAGSRRPPAGPARTAPPRPPCSCQPAPAARRVSRDEQARRQRWRRHCGPDGGGCGGRGSEATGAPPEGRRRRQQPRRQLLRPYQHRPRTSGSVILRRPLLGPAATCSAERRSRRRFT